MVGININCKNKDYVKLILDGDKVMETRECNSLDPYIGKRVGLIQTGRGRATLKGYATITAVFVYNTESKFKRHELLHRVYDSDDYRWKGKRKYGYLLEDVVECEPRLIYSKGIVAREI